MSREIKFRAWSSSGIMRSWEELVKLHVHTVFNMCQPELILMQYTGLKDKNGVEIYEGDILGGCSYRPRVVIWFDWESRFGIELDEDEDPLMLNSYKSTHDLEVIGNCHETPELLEYK